MILIHYPQTDTFDFLNGKGMQAHVALTNDGDYEVLGPPRIPRKCRVSGESLDNVRYLLSKMDPEELGGHAKAARNFGSIRTNIVLRRWV